MNIEIIKLISHDKIKAIFSSWNESSDEIVEAVIHARDSLLDTKEYREEIIPKLVFAMENGSAKVAELLYWIIAGLTERYSSSKFIIKTLADSKNARSRARAIMALSPELDITFLSAILRSMLSDSSKKVRRVAADWIGRNHFVGLVEILRHSASKEKDVDLRLMMNQELSLLTTGYFAKRKDGIVTITMMIGGARVLKVFAEEHLINMTDEEIHKKFLTELGNLEK